MSIAGLSDTQEKTETLAIGTVQLIHPEFFFTGENYPLEIYFKQTPAQADQYYVREERASYELEINNEIIEPHSLETTDNSQIKKITWYLAVPPDPNDFQLTFYVYVHSNNPASSGTIGNRQVLTTLQFYSQQAGVEGAPCDPDYDCSLDLACEYYDTSTDYGYCIRPPGEEGAPCASPSQCDMEAGLTCYVDWETAEPGDDDPGTCVYPIIVELGEECDWDYRRCNEERGHYCDYSTGQVYTCQAERGTIDNPNYAEEGGLCNGEYYLCEEGLFCNLTIKTCQPKPTTNDEEPVYVSRGEVCDNDQLLCEGSDLRCINGRCDYPIAEPDNRCSDIVCDENYTCFAGDCVFCPEPHRLTDDGQCRINCLENSNAINLSIAGDQLTQSCRCSAGYTQNDSDEYGRPVCVLNKTGCESILDCPTNFVCQENTCQPCPAPYKTIALGGNCEWSCAPNSHTQPDENSQPPVCVCKAGTIPDGRDEKGRLLCIRKPANYCDNQYEHCKNDDHICVDNRCIPKENEQDSSSTILTPEEIEVRKAQRQVELQARQDEQAKPVVTIIKEEVVDEDLEEKVEENPPQPSVEVEARELLKKEIFIQEKEQDLSRQRAQEQLTIEKKRKVIKQTLSNESERTKTEISIHVRPKKNKTNVDIVEVIPKELAQSARELSFNPPPTRILQDDPVVMWHLKDVTEEVRITYTVNKSTSLTGNTIAMSDAKRFDWRILLPLLFIPIIGLAVIGFDKMRSSSKKVF